MEDLERLLQEQEKRDKKVGCVLINFEYFTFPKGPHGNSFSLVVISFIHNRYFIRHFQSVNAASQKTIKKIASVTFLTTAKSV